ncbi:MAG: molybdopterin-synthase adenylyltransferase MoeB [Opitutales bacterium]|nr:molybdopterin-synthase adenylyltransferase MoeB [Opitutales bacterium]
MSEDTTFSRDELARYHRQMILPGMGREGQERIRAARVLIVGMGGLGSPVAMYLAAAGVGTLGLADFDKVELHNLHRQVLHGSSSVGMLKVQSATKTLSELNPNCNLVPHPLGVRAEDLPALFNAYDIVVDCTDNFPTRFMVNDAAVMARKPLVYGSIFQYEGQASFFHPANDAPCYRCLFPEMPAPDSVPNCAQAGVIGALCGIIGSIQAMEALKFVSGVGKTLSGRLLTVDAATMTTRTINIKRDPSCPVCSANARIRKIVSAEYEWRCDSQTSSMPSTESISAIELKALLGTADAPVLLDVRDPDECEMGMIAGAVTIPLYQLGSRLEELDKTRPIAVYCHIGLRSQHAQRLLKSKGFKKVMNLKGGILEWIRHVDATIRCY